MLYISVDHLSFPSDYRDKVGIGLGGRDRDRVI